MIQDNRSSETRKLLIYIPCHSDYSEAIEQATFIRKEFENIDQKQNKLQIKIHIHISINGVDLPVETLNEVNAITQSHSFTPNDIGADVNISKGYEMGINAEFSFLWVLSANERIKSGGIDQIISGINESVGCHVLLIGNQGNLLISQVENPLEEALEGKPFGLISAVIFNSDLCRRHYSLAKEFSHTGWGQLSVLVQIQNEAGVLNCLNLDSSKIYTMDVRENFDQAKEYERIGKTYARSFFGFPVLAMTLFPPPSRTGQAIFRKWLLTNLHRFAYFNSYVTDKKAVDVRKTFSEFLIETGTINRLLVSLACNPWVLRLFKFLKKGK